MELAPRARLTWCAHLFKACVKQHHRELRPALARLIGPDGVIFDVGSHSGQFAKLFAGLAPGGHVYAFEPGSYALSILRPALGINRLRNVTVLPCGLGDTPGERRLSVPVKPSGSIGFGLSHVRSVNPDLAADNRSGWRYREEVITISTVDEVAAARRIGRVDFIKADIEGWEMRMLAGAKATLSRDRPSLMIEVSDEHLARAGDNAGALFDYLAGFGYRAYKLDADLSHFVRITRPEENDIIFVAGEKDNLA
jgi:FkbM family methyltransferase